MSSAHTRRPGVLSVRGWNAAQPHQRQQHLRQLLAEAGIATPAGRRRPRLTDLRHSFAVATLVTWYAAGADVPARLPALSAYLGPRRPGVHLLVPGGLQGADDRRRGPTRTVVAGAVMTALAPSLRRYFTERLTQRRASRHTVASYRDTFCLLLRYAAASTWAHPTVAPGPHRHRRPIGRGPSSTTSNTSGATRWPPATIASPRSTPCSATRHCAARNMPRSSPGCWPSHENALDSTLVCFLTRAEVDALLAAPTGPPASADAIMPCC